jgi:adenine-specific DNA methylase
VRPYATFYLSSAAFTMLGISVLMPNDKYPDTAFLLLDGSTASLKLRAQARQHLVERYGFDRSLLNLGVTSRRQSVPRCVSSCVGIQARDHSIQ